MEVVGVVFNQNPKIYSFLPNGVACDMNTKVVVETVRGIELATVVQTVEDKDVSGLDEIRPVLRVATKNDLADFEANLKSIETIKPEIKKTVSNMNLNMKISTIEYTLDKSKIIITYTAEERVDFRELLKILGAKFKARIEMRQVGSRDEVQNIGAMGICGRECCCKAFLGDFDKVSIKMAKNQGLALNPNKINGACGRLLCCLKYEDDYYRETISKMPKINSYVETPEGKAKVLYNDIMHEKVVVLFEREDDFEKKEFALSDIKFSRVTSVNTDADADE